MSICGVVWPLMPRPTYPLPVKNVPTEARPRIGHRVAHEDDPRLVRRRRGERAVLIAIASEDGRVALPPSLRPRLTSAVASSGQLGTGGGAGAWAGAVSRRHTNPTSWNNQ